MSKFQVGDRVAIYSSRGRDTGMVVFIQPDGFLQIKYDSGQLIYPLHPKQCRKLKAKKRRSVWVDFGHRFPYHSGTFKYDCCDYPIEGWTEFKEVVKK